MKIKEAASNGRRPAVEVEGVSKLFKIPKHEVSTIKERALHPFRKTEHYELHALDRVSFQVAQGESFGIVGRNGSGKSTLLKCLAGIYKANAGAIRITGRLSPFIELGVGFNPDLTARDNVIISSVMLGLTPAEAKRRFDQIIEFAELEDYLDLKLKNYSSGMHVRLAFSVMAQVDGSVLLVDEVLAVGDAAFQQKCFEKFDQIKEEGRTLLLVTHDMTNIERFCDRALLLEAGKMVAIDEPARVSQLYNEINFSQLAEREKSEENSVDDENQELSGGERFGDGGAEIVDAWIEDKGGERIETLPQGDILTIKAEVKFNSDVKNPEFGCYVENDSDIKVVATSTAWQLMETGNFDKDELTEVTFEFENKLSPGKYYISPSVVRNKQGTDIMDYRHRTTAIYIYGTYAPGGVVDMDNQIDIKHVGNKSI